MSKARPTPLMQIPWGGINLIEWNIFLKKKKKSKHVGNVAKVSPLMRMSVWKKLWKSTHLEVELRTKSPCTQVSSPVSTTYGCISLQWGERKCLNIKIGTSLVAQWLRICLPMQGAWVRALVQEDPTCRRATKPASHNYWSLCAEPVLHNKRSHRNKKPAHRNEE